MDWATMGLDVLTLVLDALTLLIVKASFRAIRDNHSQAQEALAEGRRQSQAALAVAREQIEQSKQPILIPLSPLPLTTGELDNTNSLPFVLRNVGTGVALNIWGVLVTPKDIPRRPYAFSSQAHLLQDKELNVLFDTDQFHSFSENDKFGEYNLWPSSELTQAGTAKRLRYAGRLSLTYIDVFGIKHATIYDYTDVNEWKIVKHLRVQRDLDDMCKEKKS